MKFATLTTHPTLLKVLNRKPGIGYLCAPSLQNRKPSLAPSLCENEVTAHHKNLLEPVTWVTPCFAWGRGTSNQVLAFVIYIQKNSSEDGHRCPEQLKTTKWLRGPLERCGLVMFSSSGRCSGEMSTLKPIVSWISPL